MGWACTARGPFRQLNLEIASLGEGGVTALENGLARARDQLEIEVQVVQGRGAREQDFAARVEVAQIGEREGLARLAGAVGIGRAEVVLVTGVGR